MTVSELSHPPGTPPPEASAPGAAWAPGRARTRWGYAVWLFVGITIAVPELWAVAGNPWWLTISATVGHLEQLWNPVKMAVIALIVTGAVQLLTYPPGPRGGARQMGRPSRWRTHNGRLTRAQDGQADSIPFAVGYFPAAVLLVAGAGAATTALGAGKWVAGYVIYGLIAAAFLIVPSVLAFWFGKEVPFPTLYRTLADLDRRSHAAVVVVLAGLAVLAVHLVAYPWP